VLDMWLFLLQLSSVSLCSDTAISDSDVCLPGRGTRGSKSIKESDLEVRY
jgi:hypothetical protein